MVLNSNLFLVFFFPPGYLAPGLDLCSLGSARYDQEVNPAMA